MNRMDKYKYIRDNISEDEELCECPQYDVSHRVFDYIKKLEDKIDELENKVNELEDSTFRCIDCLEDAVYDLQNLSENNCNECIKADHRKQRGRTAPNRAINSTDELIYVKLI